MVIEVAYGLPGSGKTTLLKSLHSSLESVNAESIYVSLDEPGNRADIPKWFSQLDYEEDVILFVDFLLDNIIVFLDQIDTLSEGNSKKTPIIIHRFEPDVKQCLNNDKLRNRGISSSPTIRHMKIEKLDEDVLNHRCKNLSILVIDHEVYKG